MDSTETFDIPKWKPLLEIIGYEISDKGEVRNSHTGRILKQSQTQWGHHQVNVQMHGGCRGRRRIYIHRLVLMVFGRMPNQGEECRHLDGNPHNNNLSNLVWGTHEENVSDKYIHGTNPIGEKNPKAKLTEANVRTIRGQFGYLSRDALAKEYGVSKETIRRIAKRETWGHLK